MNIGSCWPFGWGLAFRSVERYFAEVEVPGRIDILEVLMRFNELYRAVEAHLYDFQLGSGAHSLPRMNVGCVLNQSEYHAYWASAKRTSALARNYGLRPPL